MKMFRFVCLALLATLSLTSCVKDVTDNGEVGKDVTEANTIAFNLTSMISTRTAESAPVVVNSYSLGDPIDGQQIYFEETVTTLDEVYAPEPETRGTPVYTSNFQKMSGGSFTGLAFPSGTMALSDASGAFIPEGSFTYDSYWNKWIREFNTNDPFGENAELYFFMRVPTTADGLSNLKYEIKSNGRCAIEFDYEVPLTATAQKDLLFTGRPVTKEESHNADILFHHALTGIKFATAHDNSDNDVKTYITKVEFPRGIRHSAHFTITPSWENRQYVDIPGDYSSAGAVKTKSETNVDDDRVVISQSFGETDVVDFSRTDKSFETNGAYPESFASAGNTQNLNDADATMTFWLIPQKMFSSSVMDVTFYIISGGKRSETVTRRISLYDANNVAEWKAGELRTFTLKANEIDVVIEDNIESGVKKDVTITNVGNVPEYIRAQIVGNWFGKKTADGIDGVVLGYVTPTEGDETYLTPWALGPVTSSGKIETDTFGGSFVGLPGENWVYDEESGFFYFTELVPPGKTTKALFTTFTPTATVPEVYYINRLPQRIPFLEVHLEIGIPAQAVEAPLADGSTADQPVYKDYKAAWLAAGVTAP